VATEKQIAANRANARRSTGPKSAAGKMVSSRNAYRHGLTCPLSLGADTAAKLEAIAQAVTGEGAGEEQLISAAEFARAQLELLRIRATRAEIMTAIERDSTQQLRPLVALDRYERYAHTRRRRASAKL
jgi:PHD/YefM family antitoxin component YafN of YafNO toxin-antitoxin module